MKTKWSYCFYKDVYLYILNSNYLHLKFGWWGLLSVWCGGFHYSDDFLFVCRVYLPYVGCM